MTFPTEINAHRGQKMSESERYAVVHRDKLIRANDRLPEDKDIVVAYLGLYPVIALQTEGNWYSVAIGKNIILTLIEDPIVFWTEIPKIVKIDC